MIPDPRHRLLLVIPSLAALLVITDGRANDRAEIVLTQATASGGEPLPRPVVGVASPGGATLPFHLALDFLCPAGMERQQFFVSIADTSRLQGATGSPSPQVVRIDVPLRQLQWLAQPERACGVVGKQRPPDEVTGEGIRLFRLHAGAAGYATVTCSGESGKTSAATASAPLDVWLSCPAEEPAPAAGP